LNKLQKWREHEGLTQAQAAERIGITQQSWSRYESGRVPEPDIIRQIVERTKSDTVPILHADFFDAVSEDRSGAAV
jgi:transcriptional regulator with XRE-family HTH domain